MLRDVSMHRFDSLMSNCFVNFSENEEKKATPAKKRLVVLFSSCVNGLSLPSVKMYLVHVETFSLRRWRCSIGSKNEVLL